MWCAFPTDEYNSPPLTGECGRSLVILYTGSSLVISGYCMDERFAAGYFGDPIVAAPFLAPDFIVSQGKTPQSVAQQLANMVIVQTNSSAKKLPNIDGSACVVGDSL